MGRLKEFATKMTPASTPAPLPEPHPIPTPPYEFPESWKPFVPRDPSRQHELALWRRWKENGEQPEHMEPLLDSLQKLLEPKIRTYTGKVPIPKEALRAEVTKRTIQALKRYNPERAALNTWVTHQIKGIYRYVQRNQSLSAIPEGRAGRVGDLDRAVSFLSDTHGRKPTITEIADHMALSVKEVTKLQNERRSDLLASASPIDDPFVEEASTDALILRLLPWELNPQELQVWEYLAGINGKPKVSSTGEIARLLSWNDSKVSQVKKEIAKKVKALRD